MAGDAWGRYRHHSAALLAAARSDPALVARAVRTGIEQSDPLAARAVIALAAAGTAPPDAASQLRGALAGATGAFPVRAAQALHVLTGDRAWIELIARLCRTGDEAARREAAEVLAELNLNTRSPEGGRPV